MGTSGAEVGARSISAVASKVVTGASVTTVDFLVSMVRVLSQTDYADLRAELLSPACATAWIASIILV
jgi:hypothetical protein